MPKIMKKENTIISFETFRQIGNYEIIQLTREKPDCFNQEVSVRKYKVTIELISEPLEVIQARIQELWDNCKNHYHWRPLKAMAKKYSMELDFSTIKKIK